MSGKKKQELYNKASSALSWYGMHNLEREISVNALRPWLHRHACHFLYGEDAVFHIEKSKTRKKKIFATFHQPPSAHQEFVRTRDPLRNLDGIVVVGTNQVPFFSQYVEPSRVHFVPHGIDTDFFCPDEAADKDGRTILFVGNWLRDFETLTSVVETLGRVRPEISIEIVTSEKNRPYFEGIENIRFCSGIPEEELRAKYRSASLLLVPMKDCTANNSVLEGMACGLPIVTTDIGGMRDYVDDRCAVLCKPADAGGMAEAVEGLLNDPDRLASMGRSARKRAEMFSWPRVAGMVRTAYRKAFGD